MSEIEYGNSCVMTTSQLNDDDEYVSGVINRIIDTQTEHLQYISDLEWVVPPQAMKAPQVDQLNRLHVWGWYGKFRSEGYDVLRKHFGCKREHIPYRITLRWALKLWWNHRKDWR